jgi:hypothetical protein
MSVEDHDLAWHVASVAPATATYTLAAVGISKRNARTAQAVTKILVPDEWERLDLPRKVVLELESYPPRAQRRFRWLFFATEWFPLLSGYRRRFSRLRPDQQLAFLERAVRHPRSPLRRLVISFLKQLVYGTYIAEPSVEATIGYSGGYSGGCLT